MAKFYNSRVKTGKLAGSVFSIRNGETIERAYQPIVMNPRTDAQVANRAKLKLMSQLSAVMAPFIAIPRVGNQSSRNLFVKKNFGAVTYANDQADVTLTSVKLTNSVLSLPPVVAGERATENIPVYLDVTGSAPLDLDRVVYIAFARETDGTLRYAGSAIAEAPSANNSWPTTIPMFRTEGVIYGYGIRFNSEDQRVAFGNLTVETAAQVAKLIVTRGTNSTDITLTETRAVNVPAVQ